MVRVTLGIVYISVDTVLLFIRCRVVAVDYVESLSTNCDSLNICGMHMHICVHISYSCGSMYCYLCVDYHDVSLSSVENIFVHSSVHWRVLGRIVFMRNILNCMWIYYQLLWNCIFLNLDVYILWSNIIMIGNLSSYCYQSNRISVGSWLLNKGNRCSCGMHDYGIDSIAHTYIHTPFKVIVWYCLMPVVVQGVHYVGYW